MRIECLLITYFVAASVGTVEAAAQAEDGDPCDPNPCIHGRECTYSDNSYECTCTNGFSGADCSININECASNPCQNGGRCIDGVNGYTCSCKSGYWGVHCATVDIDECASNPCINATCIDQVGGYICETNGQVIMMPTTKVLLLTLVSKIIWML